jgi:hypothetical protein
MLVYQDFISGNAFTRPLSIVLLLASFGCLCTKFLGLDVTLRCPMLLGFPYDQGEFHVVLMLGAVKSLFFLFPSTLCWKQFLGRFSSELCEGLVVAWIVRVSVRGLYWEVEFFFGDFSKKRGFMTWEKLEVWDGYRSGGVIGLQGCA